jgi:predicted transcriptional regulator
MSENLLHRLKEARQNLMRVKVELRNKTHDRDTVRDILMIDNDYSALGKNPKARETAFARILRDDPEHSHLARIVRELEDDADRAEFELEAVLDERRHKENVTYAKAVDYLKGRVDHIRLAPAQAIRTAIQSDIKAEIGAAIEENARAVRDG